MRLRTACLTACILLLFTSFAQNLKHQLAGTWKYDMTTFQFTVDPTVAEAMKRDKETAEKAPALLEQQVKTLKEAMKPLRFTLLPGGRYSVGNGKDKPTGGTWKVVGDKVMLEFDSHSPNRPDMKVLPGGRKISMSFFGKGFGSVTCTLVRA